MNNNTFGERLFQLRTSRGFSRQKAAEALGISRQSLEYYEKGTRKPDIEVLAMLAGFYAVSADYLLGFTDAATDDADLRAVCDYTGLDAGAAQYVCRDAYPGKEMFKTLNLILKSTDFFQLVKIAAEYEKENAERAERIKKYIGDFDVLSNRNESRTNQFAQSFLKSLGENEYQALKELVRNNDSIYKITDYVYDHSPGMQEAFNKSGLELQTFRAQKVVEEMLLTLSALDETSPAFQSINFYEFVEDVARRVDLDVLEEVIKEREQQKKQEQEDEAEE